MKETIRALLVSCKNEPFDALHLVLQEQSIGVSTAGNCAEAVLALWSDCPPHLVFTELQLPDGNWGSVLTLAAKAPAHVNVIVMAPFVDVGLYVQAIERGAFDFIVAPHSDPELWHVIRIAAENALARRKKRAATSATGPVAGVLAPAWNGTNFAGLEGATQMRKLPSDTPTPLQGAQVNHLHTPSPASSDRASTPATTLRRTQQEGQR